MRHVALAYGSDALRNKWGVGGYGVPTPIAKWCLAAQPNGRCVRSGKTLADDYQSLRTDVATMMSRQRTRP